MRWNSPFALFYRHKIKTTSNINEQTRTKEKGKYLIKKRLTNKKKQKMQEEEIVMTLVKRRQHHARKIHNFHPVLIRFRSLRAWLFFFSFHFLHSSWSQCYILFDRLISTSFHFFFWCFFRLANVHTYSILILYVFFFLSFGSSE